MYLHTYPYFCHSLSRRRFSWLEKFYLPDFVSVSLALRLLRRVSFSGDFSPSFHSRQRHDISTTMMRREERALASTQEVPLVLLSSLVLALRGAFSFFFSTPPLFFARESARARERALASSLAKSLYKSEEGRTAVVCKGGFQTSSDLYTPVAN